MPTHDLEMSVPAQTIKNSDATISVWADGELLGRLKVSKGSIDWVPGHAVKWRYRLSWEKFHDLMCDNGRRSAIE
jgi:hypothetical protein